MQMDTDLVGSPRSKPTLKKGRVRESLDNTPESDRWFTVLHYSHERTLRGMPANRRANLPLFRDLHRALCPRRRKYKRAVRALNRSIGELARQRGVGRRAFRYH
jgi:hypothetical protein